MELTKYSNDLARKALELGAIGLSPEKPFCWASGYYMPIYNDNRSFLGDYQARRMIAMAFSEILGKLGFDPDNIAGTSTAGIPHATTLGDLLQKPVTYIRSSSKDHGLQHQIEGLGPKAGYEGTKVVLIEDLISTGMSALRTFINSSVEG